MACLSQTEASAWSIDSNRAKTLFGNAPMEISLATCEARLGSGPNPYPLLDIQKRVATWLIPLFLLIGSMQFAPLGWKNVGCVIVHLVSDPNSCFESLLSRLHALKEHSKHCQRISWLPVRVRHAVAAIVAAREECDVHIEAYAPHATKTSSSTGDLYDDLQIYLGHTLQPTPKQQSRRNACVQAANELSDTRICTMSKAIFGTVNYMAVVIAAFLHVQDGEFNNRTGHSMAAAMLYSWLLPTVNLSALLGTFVNKRSAEDALFRLEQAFTRIETEELSGPWNQHDLRTIIPQVSPPAANETNLSDKQIHSAHCYSGGNPTFRPHQSDWGATTSLNRLLSNLPTSISTLSAALISYTSPTRGLGCRSLWFLCIFTGWLLSYAITALLRRTVPSARLQWKIILIKDTIFFPFQISGLFGGFVGWFNSCFCWSAVFSLGRDRAYVLVNQEEEIRRLARSDWPALTCLALGFQLLLFVWVWWWYKEGVYLYIVDEKERIDSRCKQAVAGMEGS